VFVVCLVFAFAARAGWIALMIGGLRGRGLWVGVGNGVWLVRSTVASLALAVVCHLFSAAMALIEGLSWPEAGTVVWIDSALVGLAFEVVAWVEMCLAVAAAGLHLPRDSSRHPLPQFQPPRS